MHLYLNLDIKLSLDLFRQNFANFFSEITYAILQGKAQYSQITKITHMFSVTNTKIFGLEM